MNYYETYLDWGPDEVAPYTTFSYTVVEVINEPYSWGYSRGGYTDYEVALKEILTFTGDTLSREEAIDKYGEHLVEYFENYVKEEIPYS